jgi:hypothetical protein
LSDFAAVKPHYLKFNVTLTESTLEAELESFEEDPEDPYFEEDKKLSIKGGTIYVDDGDGFDYWSPTCARE